MMRLLLGVMACASTALALLLQVSQGGPASAAGNSISSPDTVGDVGQFSSLQLDGSGNPVVTYYDATNGHLKVLHCNDPECIGADESITSPDTDVIQGSHTSLELDGFGHPVVAYAALEPATICVPPGSSFCYPGYKAELRVLHCNDPDCAGGDESITLPDSEEDVGRYASLVLGADGNPVISYHAADPGHLKLLRCNDAECSGGDESIEVPDTESGAGHLISLALDPTGNPVISHFDFDYSTLRLVVCNDPLCAGGDDSTTELGMGAENSVAVDGTGNPVIAFSEAPSGQLRVIRCGNPSCTTGNSNVGPFSGLGAFPSLQLDGMGYPVVAFVDHALALRILHCGTPSCDSGGFVASTDSSADLFSTTLSLAMDGMDKPVVSYYDRALGDLKVLHCSDPLCKGTEPQKVPTASPTVTATPTPSVTRTPTFTATPFPSTPTPFPVGGVALDAPPSGGGASDPRVLAAIVVVAFVTLGGVTAYARKCG